MQQEPLCFRARGYRESTELVELGKSSACDLKKIAHEIYQGERNYEVVADQIDTLRDTRVSQFLHLRAQLRFRLRHRE